MAGISVSKVNLYAVLSPPIGISVSKVNLYAVLDNINLILGLNDTLSNWNDEVSTELGGGGVVPLTLEVEDDGAYWLDDILSIWPLELSNEDELNDWDDSTENWGDLSPDDNLNNFDDSIELFSALRLSRSDTLNVWRDAATRIVPLRRTVTITDSFSGTKSGQATNRTTLRDGFSLFSFGAALLFVTDDVNQWTDFVDADSIETLIGVNTGLGDLFLLIDNIKLLLNYFLSRNDRLELADEFNQGASGNPEQADDLNNWNDLVQTFIPLALEGISVSDSLNNWLDIVIILLSTSIQSYIRRYLNDVINNDTEHPTIVELPIREPAMILYLRRYLNDLNPTLQPIQLNVEETFSMEDNI